VSTNGYSDVLKTLIERNGSNGINGIPNLKKVSSPLRGSFVRNHYAETVEGASLDSGKETECSFESDLVVVLDMDECLLHSQFLKAENDYRQHEDGRPGSRAFDHDDEPEAILSSLCDSFKVSLPDGDMVHVNKRPGLDHFLKEITSRYETYIFTAAMQIYASPVLDILDQDRNMFQQRFYREHCTFDTSHGVYVKNLESAFQARKQNGEKIKEFNKGRVVLIDNNPYSFLANPRNGILVSNFYDDPKDCTLDAVSELLQELDEIEDVRPVLDAKFGLKDALHEIQINQRWK
jgi:CTD small phosphatase-like protein 2